MRLGVDRQAAHRRVYGHAFQGLDDLFGIARAGLLDGRGIELDAVVGQNRPHRGCLGTGSLGQPGLELLMGIGRRVVPKLVGVGPDVVGIGGAQLARHLVAGDLATGDVDVILEEAEGRRLLGEVDEMVAPQAAGHGLAAGAHDLGDVGVEVGGAQFGPELDDDLGARRMLGQGLDDAVAEVVAVSIVELDVTDLLAVHLGDDLRHGVALEVGVRGRAEDVGVQFRRRHLDGLGDGGDVDHLLLARHFRDGQADARGKAADQYVDAFLGDQLLGRGRSGGRVELGITARRDHFHAKDTAGGIDFVDPHIVAAHGRAAVDGAAARDGIEHADLDFGGISTAR